MDDSYRSMVESLRQMNKSLQGVSQTLVHIMEHNIWKQIGQATVALDEYSKSLATMAHEFRKTRVDFGALGQMYTSFAEVGRVVGEYASKIDYSGLARLGELAASYNAYKTENWETLRETLELFRSTALTRQMEEMLPKLEEIDPRVFEVAQHFDMSAVEIEDDKLVFDGVEYTEEDLSREMNAQIEGLNSSEDALYEKYELLKKKYWIPLLILWVFLNIPQWCDTIKWYVDKAEDAYEFVVETYRECQTIKENAKLRAEPTPQAPVLMTVPLHTRLEILESVPRWHQVKYIDQNQEELRAWVSKVSVETEE